MSDVQRQINDLWYVTNRLQADLSASTALLRTCVALLKDDPRFVDALRVNADLRNLQNRPENDQVLSRVKETLTALVPEQHRSQVKAG